MKSRKKESSRSQYDKKQGTRRLTVVSGWLLSVAAFIVGGFIVLGISGKYNLEKQAAGYEVKRNETVLPVMGAQQEEGALSEGRILQGESGQIEYGGRFYSYNEDILTFLLIGLGREETEAFGTERARAKALSLAVLDPREKKLKLIPINCNTMIPVEVYDAEGKYAGTVTARIGVRHGFEREDGTSFGYQVKAVQELFYGIPIHAYMAADLDAFCEAARLMTGTDGGLPQELAEKAGEGGQEYLLTELIGVGIERIRENPGAAVEIYHEMSGRIETDLTADEAAYLAALISDYRLDEGGIVAIPGRNGNEEEDTEGSGDGFYVDNEAFYRLVLDIFFEPME